MSTDLPEIRRRAEEFKRLQDAATPGPWRWWDFGDATDTKLISNRGMRAFVLDCVRSGMQGASFRLRHRATDTMRKVTAASLNVEPDSALIAASRTITYADDVAALLAEIERLTDQQRKD